MVLPYNIAPVYERSSTTDNAVSPAWREAIAYVIMCATINCAMSAEDIMEARYNFTQGSMQNSRDISPGAGSYSNEGDCLEPSFQWSYFDSFYPSLLELKKRYDPFNFFYAMTAVGSELFEVRSVDGVANENGRPCHKPSPDLYEVEGPDWQL